jgi:hypothetical protein
MIVFKSNGVITHQFIKDDIEKIYITRSNPLIFNHYLIKVMAQPNYMML